MIRAPRDRTPHPAGRVPWTTLLVAALIVGAPTAAEGYSTSAVVSIQRQLSPTRAQPGQTVDVTLTLTVGAIGASPLRGLFISEAVPNGLIPAGVAVTLDGASVAALGEAGAADAVYPGATIHRWVLETPPSWTEGRAVSENSTVTVSYQVTVPAGASAGLTFPGASWVGMIADQGDAGDHFGYEDSETVLPVESPPSMALDHAALSFEATEGGANPPDQIVNLTNAGDGDLGSVTTSLQYGAGATGWLTVTASPSTGGAWELQNVVEMSGLAPNTYAATVEVSASGADNSPQSYTVSVTIAAKPSTTQPTLVLTPASLQFSGQQGSAPPDQEVAVSNSGVDTLAPVSVQVSFLSGDGWLQVNPSGEGNEQQLINRVSLEGLSPGTYSALVAASSAGASNDPQNYTVTLAVTPTATPAQDGGPTAQDGGPPVHSDGGAALDGADGPPQGLTPTLEGGCALAPHSSSWGLLPPLASVVLLLLGCGRIRREIAARQFTTSAGKSA